MLKVEKKGSVLSITLARPEVRNAFNDELIQALTLAVMEEASTCRVAILSGEGKAFCAGGDLNWMKKAAGYTHEENVVDAIKLSRLYQAIVDSPTLFVCAVHGAVFGGGCGLAAASDYCVAAEGTQFAFSEVRLGLVPATISRVVTPKIGPSWARAYYTTGLAFSAEKALAMGLVHEVVPPENLTARTDEIVAQALTLGPSAVSTSKDLSQAGVLTHEAASELLATVRGSEEGREGIAAFLEKRPASFVVKP